ncbi:hypothetical protein JXA80_04340, partial [bacterium]|nr:hypothetical protein [candidate division CSSED10-310 bacterium]
MILSLGVTRQTPLFCLLPVILVVVTWPLLTDHHLVIAAGPSVESPSESPATGILPLDQVTAGMMCTGYSCFSGTELEPMQVEIVGIIGSGLPANKMILGRVDSPSV